ncbi:MAG: hypothetical protein U9R51_07670 [Actinomycetota bacterium]|nr:hypothetical protein [Actinomycetota bacterium]
MDSGVDGGFGASEDRADLGMGQVLPVGKAEELLVFWSQRRKPIDRCLFVEVAQNNRLWLLGAGRSLPSQSSDEPTEAASTAIVIPQDAVRYAVEPENRLVVGRHNIDTAPRNGEDVVRGVGGLVPSDTAGEVGEYVRVIAVVQTPESQLAG